MKKMIVMVSIAFFVSPLTSFAQKSNASSGPYSFDGSKLYVTVNDSINQIGTAEGPIKNLTFAGLGFAYFSVGKTMYWTDGSKGKIHKIGSLQEEISQVAVTLTIAYFSTVQTLYYTDGATITTVGETPGVITNLSVSDPGSVKFYVGNTLYTSDGDSIKEVVNVK